MLCKKQILNKSDVFETTNDIVQKANFAFNEMIGSVAASEISPNVGRWSLEQKKEQFLTIDRF
tara:strand:- start:275 stop:463 length:189 start_codon:yes stop_codon:yes gene_type:complete